MWLKLEHIDLGIPAVKFSVSSRELAVRLYRGEISILPLPEGRYNISECNPADLEQWFLNIVEKIWPEYKGGALIAIDFRQMNIMFQYIHKDFPRLKVYNTLPQQWDMFNRCVDCNGPVRTDQIDYERVCIPEPETSPYMFKEGMRCGECVKCKPDTTVETK
jgi:hypothetical protein